MKSSTMLPLIMGASAMAQAIENKYNFDSLRSVGGSPSFRGMKVGGINKHFNKKRHGKMLRRKHARS